MKSQLSLEGGLHRSHCAGDSLQSRAQRVVGIVWRRLAAAAKAVALKRRIRREMRELEQLDAATLKDIGMARSEIGSYSAELAGFTTPTWIRSVKALPVRPAAVESESSRFTVELSEALTPAQIDVLRRQLLAVGGVVRVQPSACSSRLMTIDYDSSTIGTWSVFEHLALLGLAARVIRL